MLRKRLTARFEAVYILDPALLVFSDDEIAAYQRNGRNLDDLDLSRCSEPPTIFICDPLRPKYEHLVDMVLSSESAASWQIFRTHVKDIKNGIDEDGKPLLEFEDGPNGEVKEECRERIPRDVVQDIALTIVLKANELSKGFPPRERLWAERARMRLLAHADGAHTGTVSGQAGCSR